MNGKRLIADRSAAISSAARAGHARCKASGMDSDLRYVRPCKWLLAAGAAINWVAAMLVVLNAQGGEAIGRYAGMVMRFFSPA
jgi:hypothetical protein